MTQGRMHNSTLQMLRACMLKTQQPGCKAPGSRIPQLLTQEYQPGAAALRFPAQASIQSAESFTFDLADSFPSEAQRFADFLQSLRFTVVQAKSHPQNRRFAGVHFIQQA